MRILFVCNQNQNRSKTAEEIFRNRFETKSAGLYNEHPVKSTDLEWADIVCVMEDSQRTELSKRFPKEYLHKRIVSLDIPDVYKYNQDKLIDILKTNFEQSIH
ncbi:MAG TPA: phosphotyrosine protein phosphatase [Alphaproteobacteria bacterium]|nr:phosphotyrosine protein phosphatase [Alphaproteobacteria bacterium]